MRRLTPRQRRIRDRLVRNKRRECRRYGGWLNEGDDVNVACIFRNGGFIGPVESVRHRSEALRMRSGK